MIRIQTHACSEIRAGNLPNYKALQDLARERPGNSQADGRGPSPLYLQGVNADGGRNYRHWHDVKVHSPSLPDRLPKMKDHKDLEGWPRWIRTADDLHPHQLSPRLVQRSYDTNLSHPMNELKVALCSVVPPALVRGAGLVAATKVVNVSREGYRACRFALS